MSNKVVDDDIQDLKKEIAKLRLEVERAHAVTACQNLMNKYSFYHMKGMTTEETHLFALKTPGGAVEMLWGIYDEPEGILRWKRAEGYGKPPEPGVLPLHAMTTPIIEVAKDGQTARGLWLMIGAESGKMPDEEKGSATWAAGQFAMDFIKEDGEWKIWRYNTVGLIQSPFEKGWHIENGKRLEEMLTMDRSDDEFAPDRPASYPWMWSPEKLIEDIPPVPLPYETWDDSLACVPAPGKTWKVLKQKRENAE